MQNFRGHLITVRYKKLLLKANFYWIFNNGFLTKIITKAFNNNFLIKIVTEDISANVILNFLKI
jgi:hypothetical protein